jgi:hypothetical protein
MIKPLFQTTDDTIFDNHVDATSYEEDCFRKWLKEPQHITPEALRILFDDQVYDTYHGTEHDRALDIFRTIYEGTK